MGFDNTHFKEARFCIKNPLTELGHTWEGPIIGKKLWPQLGRTPGGQSK